MINTTDLNEVEVLLPGDWRREDNGDIYSFTTDKMEMKDRRLFKQLVIRHTVPTTVEPPGINPVETLQWALMIKDDYCGIVAGNREFVITEIGHQKDEAVHMVWEADGGRTVIRFRRV